MNIIKNPKGEGYYLDLSEEELEKLKPFLNRYGLLDHFPLEMPKEIQVYDWMFPESIKSDSNGKDPQEEGSYETEWDEERGKYR